MTLVGAPSAPIPAVAVHRSLAATVLVPLATVVAIVAIAILPLLTPLVLHPLLDATGADLWLGTTPAITHGLSDATVTDLVLGGPFAVAVPGGSPLYAADEVAHLRDARLLLWLLLGGGLLGVAGLGVRLTAGIDRRGTWRGVARGGAIAAAGTLILGVVGWFAFEPLFELFHRLFFPGGNWAFDARTSRLVQLYPFAFWELAAAGLGAGVVVLGTVTWVVGRRRGRGVGADP
jgi:hypothetical protein